METILIVFMVLFLCMTPLWIFFMMRCGSYAIFLSLRDVFFNNRKKESDNKGDEK